MPNLRTYVKTVRVSNAVASGTTLVTSSSVDMQGFDGVVFVALLGSTVGTGVALSAFDSPDNSTFTQLTTLPSGGVGGVLTGIQAAVNIATPAAVTVTDVNKQLVLDVFRPLQRFVQVQLTRGTATILDGILAIQYAAKKEPTALDATVSQAFFGVANN